MFSKEELTFLYQLLDQITVRGLPQKQTVLVVMAKIAAELEKQDGDVPETPETRS